MLALEPQIIAWARRFAPKENALFLGRGLHYPIALEGALKLKEISYIHAEAYPAGELKHGPLALVTSPMPVVTVAPNDALLEKLESNMQEVRARGGELFVFADADTRILPCEGVNVIRLPEHYGVLRRSCMSCRCSCSLITRPWRAALMSTSHATSRRVSRSSERFHACARRAIRAFASASSCAAARSSCTAGRSHGGFRRSSTRRYRMNARLKHLRDLVVALDLNDRNVRKLAPQEYRDAAAKALVLTHQEMGLLPMADFAGPISALQTMAENIYFKAHGRFADLDATGRATVAKTESRALYRRMRPASPVRPKTSPTS